MSIAVMTAVWAEAPVAGSELLMALAIADSANDEGVAFPSYRYLAKKTRLSERQAMRVVRKLIDAGVVELVEQGGMVGKRKLANVYSVPTSWRGDILSPPDAGDTPTSDAGDAPRVTPVSDQPSLESSSSTEQQADPWRTKAAVDAAFGAWLEAAQPPMQKLTAARERDTRRLLAVTEDINYAIQAIKGFVSASKGGDKSIGSLLKTGPGTSSLASRIDYFASKAPGANGVSSPRIPDGVADMTRQSLRALLGELDKATEEGDDEHVNRALSNVPSGFQPVKGDDGRWKVVRG